MSLALSAGQRSHRAWAETLHAEWTKLRTLASTGWLLAGAVALTVAVSAATVATAVVYAFPLVRGQETGSRDRTRTYNLPVNSRTLCRLSYAGSADGRSRGREPAL